MDFLYFMRREVWLKGSKKYSKKAKHFDVTANVSRNTRPIYLTGSVKNVSTAERVGAAYKMTIQVFQWKQTYLPEQEILWVKTK